MVLYFKEKCICFGPLSPSMSICLRLKMQDPGVEDTPIDPQREMEFLIKILPTSKISLSLNRHIKKIFLPCINSIAALPSPKELNQCVSQKS